jgi:hypothetical protein
MTGPPAFIFYPACPSTVADREDLARTLGTLRLR